MSTGVRRGRFTPEDRAESIYRYVPIEVEDGAQALSVTYEFDRDAGVLDLGVFDPAGTFRGYSGGARDGFAITLGDATPGYLAGALPEGEWQVLLGLYHIPPAGLEWQVHWSTEPAAPAPQPQPGPPPERPPRRGLPAPAGTGWLAGDLHAHTLHSDGTATIDELAGLARARGLDFLAITDHNTVSHHPHLPAASRRVGIELLAGQEVTTDTGHANCLGDIGWVDFRREADDWVGHTRAHGGVFSINHPVLGDWTWRKPLAQPPSHVEVWHGLWDGADQAVLRWWQDRGGIPVGGTDAHIPARGDRPGAPTTWVHTQAGEGILDALAAGRTAVSAAPDGPLLLRVDGELVAVDAEGTRCLPGETLLDGGPRRPGRHVRGDLDHLGARSGWHVLLDRAGHVIAMTC